MIFVKTKKPIHGRAPIGISRIDGMPMYKFEKFEDLVREGISSEDCQIITDTKGSVDYESIQQKLNIDKIKNMIEL